MRIFLNFPLTIFLSILPNYVVVPYDTYDLEVGFLLALEVIWRLVLLISLLFHYQLHQCGLGPIEILLFCFVFQFSVKVHLFVKSSGSNNLFYSRKVIPGGFTICKNYKICFLRTYAVL